MAKVDSVSARKALVSRREPYWHRLEALGYLGYRKSADGSGSWIVRTQDAKTGFKKYKALGSFLEISDGDRFDAAQKAAKVHLQHLENGGLAESITVGEACQRYVVKQRDDGKDAAVKDLEGRFRRWMFHGDYKKLCNTPITKLTQGQVGDWRIKITKAPVVLQDKSKTGTEKKAPSSINRDMAVLKAALNLALRDGYATNDTAWKYKLTPIKNASRRRDCYLDIAQRRALIQHSPTDLAVLLRAMALVPLRPGAVAALTVGNFDKRLSALTVGQDKGREGRKITLPASTAAFFSEHASDKLPAAPLFTKADGIGWNKDNWKYPFKDAVIAAGLPLVATAYALRHSTITDLLTDEKSPLDAMTVAVLSGTSIAMIEKHYGHLLHDRAAKGLAALAL